MKVVDLIMSVYTVTFLFKIFHFYFQSDLFPPRPSSNKSLMPLCIVVTWGHGICLISMAEGIHIRKITSAYVSSSMYYFQHSKNCPNLQFTALHIYIAMGSHCDHGDYYFDVSMTFMYTMLYSSFDHRFKIKHVQKFFT